MNLYTSGDIANLCGVARSTACNWLNRGNIPLPKITTVGGISLWTEVQAQEIKTKYDERQAKVAAIIKLKAELDALREGDKQ